MEKQILVLKPLPSNYVDCFSRKTIKTPRNMYISKYVSSKNENTIFNLEDIFVY